MSYHTLTGNYLRGQQPLPVREVTRTAAGVKGHLVKTADLPEAMPVSTLMLFVQTLTLPVILKTKCSPLTFLPIAAVSS